MAAFNASAHVEQSLRSALASTLRDIEVVVVDDCSTDDTLARVAAVAAADPRVRIEAVPVNGGVAASRNRALALARGRWFAILDSDDLIAADRLERLVADMIADNLVVFEDGHPETAKPFLAGAQPEWIGLEAYLGNARMLSGDADYGYLKPLLRRESLNALGIGYDERLRIAEDDDLVVRLLLAGLRYRLEPFAGYGYRRHRGSTSYRLSAADAGAIVAASTALCGAAPNAALRARHRRFVRAHAFARMVEAIKAKRFGMFAGLALSDPGALPLLRLPLMAALGRMAGTAGTPQPGEPQAVAALAEMLAAADR
jgi:succinoglycan biosynthesis protein ExoO